MDNLATVQLTILFWYYKEPAICANRLQLLRRLNPGVRIYGLYGGEISHFAEYDATLKPWLDDNWAFPEDKDTEWKWRHGDLMISAWHRSRGHTLPWETLVIMQWDMIALAPIPRIFGPMQNGTLYLPGLRPMTQLEARATRSATAFRAGATPSAAPVSNESRKWVASTDGASPIA